MESGYIALETSLKVHFFQGHCVDLNEDRPFPNPD